MFRFVRPLLAATFILAVSCNEPCPAGQQQCSDSCFDLQNDSSNCGACGAACPDGQSCQTGECKIACATGLSACEVNGEQSCANFATDSNNCGSCGTRCATGSACVSGTCTTQCAAGRTLCTSAGGSSCNDLNADGLNCGACGTACAAGQFCSNGTCRASCASGLATCTVDGGPGYCANAQTDNANCGACGTTCSSGEVCSLGSCQTTCGNGLSTCTPDAGAPYCANTQSDNVNCGSCGQSCGAGESCRSGVCTLTCSTGLAVCGTDGGPSFCSNPQTDNFNCGGCGIACAPGELCSDGDCVTSCASNLTTCSVDGGAPFCSNTQTDNFNCGTCGTTCAPGQICSGGQCATTCAPGLATCTTDAGVSECANTANDNGNCGGCGITCAPGQVCSMGNCATTCASTLTTCPVMNGPSYCASTQTDLYNCGMCGRTCAAGETCTGGNCATSCQAGLTKCTPADAGADYCANTQTDNRNCGTCGTSCGAGRACSGGQCVVTCGSGLTVCAADAGAPYCANTQTDNANCGTCGTACAQGRVCVGGMCQTSCQPGMTLCQPGGSPYCANTLTDNANCGTCGTTCTAGQVCSSGTCQTNCGGGLTTCAGADGGAGYCANTVFDPANCGACGNACTFGEFCNGGTCSNLCGQLSACPGDAGTHVCLDTQSSNANCGVCGAACSASGSTCGGGFCSQSLTTAPGTTLNLSNSNINGRVCAPGGEAVHYSVVALTATTATVSPAINGSCVVAGDEMLLINLQGTATATANVGNYELVRVQSVSGSTVTFAKAKTRFYGNGANDDTNLGTTASTQRVMLQRVPSYTTVTLPATATLTADSWDGVLGGVLAVRATTSITIDGTVTMAGKGYTGGTATNTVNTTGLQGESLAGSTNRGSINLLGGGGGGIGDNQACEAFGASAGGGAHLWPGSKGKHFCSGHGGAPYGNATMTKIFFGSGGGSGGTDNTLGDNPVGGAGGRGGGIVMLLTPSLTVTGAVDVSGTAGQGDPVGTSCSSGSTSSCWDFSGPGGGGAGGSFYTSASTFNGRNRVLALGGLGGSGYALAAGVAGSGSPGRMYPMPTSCADVPTSAGDGMFVFALPGNPSQTHMARCVGVGTMSPTMYLPLYNTGATQNYSKYDATRLDGENGSTTLTTRWQALRFTPSTKLVTTNDFTFTMSTGSINGGPFAATSYPYANAGDCACGGPLGSANIDLRGVAFAVSGNNDFTAQGSGESGSGSFSHGNQVFSSVGGGCCGDFAPRAFSGNLELAYKATPSSCLAIKQADPAATDGIYAVQPTPAFPPAPVYCDMTTAGGGWALVHDSNAIAPYSMSEAIPVRPNSATFLPVAFTRALAANATQVHVRTTGQAATRSFTTVANTQPIINLREGLNLNQAGTPYSLSAFTGPFAVSARLDFVCTPNPTPYPNVYHACGNGFGFHELFTQTTWDNTQANEPMQMFVR